MLSNIFLVGLGSFLGGSARYLINLLLSASPGRLPLATLSVNVVGCFLIGLLSAFFARNSADSATWRLFLIVGFCGGFTTFSTFINENFLLLRGGQLWIVLGYLLLSIALGFLSLYAGYRLAH